MNLSKEIAEKARNTRMLVLDVDGVLTDGALIIGDDGQEYKRFYAHDGLGLRMLRNTGVKLAIITGRTSKVVEKRAAEMDVEYLYQGQREKLPAFKELCEKTNLTPEQTAFMGDDVIDLSILSRTGFALTVADGHPLVKQHAHWISERRGGYGAVREVCDLIMSCQNTLDEQLTHHFG